MGMTEIRLHALATAMAQTSQGYVDQRWPNGGDCAANSLCTMVHRQQLRVADILSLETGTKALKHRLQATPSSSPQPAVASSQTRHWQALTIRCTMTAAGTAVAHPDHLLLSCSGVLVLIGMGTNLPSTHGMQPPVNLLRRSEGGRATSNAAKAAGDRLSASGGLL